MARKKKEKGEAGFEPGSGGGRSRLTPVDVQEKVFRLGFRGYREQEVDEFLDQVTEDLAVLHEENKRLRERVEQGGGGPPGAVEDAQRRAEDVVRQAREYAARLVEEAEQRVGGGGAPASFLVRERDFLQQMAGLIQGHAEALKREARRAKESAPAPGPGPVPAPAAAPVAPAPAASPPPPAPVPEPEPQPAVEPAVPDTEATQSHDPLLDWDGGVSGGPEDQPYEESDIFGDERSSGGAEDDQSSLRELFWGEE